MRPLPTYLKRTLTSVALCLAATTATTWAQEKLPYWKRPDAALLTLHHGMERKEAREVFRKYNTMTQLLVNGEWFHVTAFTDGTGPVDKEVRFLS